MLFITAMIAQIVRWKDTNADLKILLAVGGWTHGSAPFTDMVSTEAKRTTFINHAITFLRDKGTQTPSIYTLYHKVYACDIHHLCKSDMPYKITVFIISPYHSFYIYDNKQ